MRIGQLSKRSGVSIPTLRFYEREKLLREPPRTSSGYRSYTDCDLERVQFIRDAQALGFTLREVLQLMQIHQPGTPPAGPTRDRWREAFRIAEERLSLIDRKIEELQAFRKRLAGGLECASRENFLVCPASASRRPKPSRQRGKLNCPW